MTRPKPTRNIPITWHHYNVLRRRYERAISQGKDQFECFGNVYLTSFAKYQLEYMQTVLGRKSGRER